MAAYVIAEVEVTDPAGFAEYQQMAGPIVAKYGGRLVAAGPPVASLEGDWQPKGVTVVEFPSVEHVRQWHDAPEYQEPKRLRQASARCSLVLIDGLPVDATA
ncbi:MAG: DUF1330 domain-containing protein [Dehalococcoidia bacterium]